jgi:hypothetical protein
VAAKTLGKANVVGLIDRKSDRIVGRLRAYFDAEPGEVTGARPMRTTVIESHRPAHFWQTMNGSHPRCIGAVNIAADRCRRGRFAGVSKGSVNIKWPQ